MKNVQSLLKSLVSDGVSIPDHTGQGRVSLFNQSLKFDLSKGFPLITTKKVNHKLAFGEMLWFINGETTLPELRIRSNLPVEAATIWSKDAENYWATGSVNANYDKQGEDLGYIYGYFWRRMEVKDFDGCDIIHDQLDRIVNDIREVVANPNSPKAFRLKLEAWQPYDHTVGVDRDGAGLPLCALPPCHTGFQVFIVDGKLNLHFNMRSNDAGLGLPFNIAGYALLAHILAQLANIPVGELHYFSTNVHVYGSHLEAVKEWAEREELSELPTLKMPKFKDLHELVHLTANDFKVVGYEPQSFIKMEQTSQTV